MTHSKNLIRSLALIAEQEKLRNELKEDIQRIVNLMVIDEAEHEIGDVILVNNRWSRRQYKMQVKSIEGRHRVYTNIEYVEGEYEPVPKGIQFEIIYKGFRLKSNGEVGKREGINNKIIKMSFDDIQTKLKEIEDEQ